MARVYKQVARSLDAGMRGAHTHRGREEKSRPNSGSKRRHIPAPGRVTAVTAHPCSEPALTTPSYIVVSMSTSDKLGSLNAPQRKAVTYGEPLPGGKGHRSGPL